MQYKDLNVGALANMVRKHFPAHADAGNVGKDFIQKLNAMVWRLNWVDLGEDHRLLYDEKEPENLIQICRDCEKLAEKLGEVDTQIGAVVLQGTLKGLYVYDTERSILSAHLEHEHSFFVYLVDDLAAGLIEREPDTEVFEVLG